MGCAAIRVRARVVDGSGVWLRALFRLPRYPGESRGPWERIRTMPSAVDICVRAADTSCTAPRRRGSRSDWRGLFFWGCVLGESARVVLFIDYQNAYNGAREAFHGWGAAFTAGQFDPVALGESIVAASPFPRELTNVRVYRGQPDATKDPRGYAACERQCARWRERAKATVVTRTLRYPPEYPSRTPEEKGIDVALAIDFVGMAVRGEYDVGILRSVDTDLKPALEFVCNLPADTPGPRCEVAAWSSPNGHSRRLAIKERKIWCHWLNEARYRSVADPTDYTVPRS